MSQRNCNTTLPVNRNNFITIAKAIGIILMVIGHSRGFALVDRVIYYFHMPLFFACSGYYLNTSNSIICFFTKRIKGLYIPYFKWTLVVFILHNILYELNFYNKEFGTSYYSTTYFAFKDYVRYIIPMFLNMEADVTRVLGGFWFIKVLLLSSLFVFCLEKVLKGYDFAKIGLILFLSILLRKYNIGLPVLGDLSIIFFGAVFYSIGYMTRFYRVSFYKDKLFTILGFLFLFVIAIFWNDYSMFCEYNAMIQYVVVAQLGIYVVFGFSYYLDKYKPVFLYYIGNNTLTILGLHFLAFKLISIIKIHYYDLPYTALAQFPVVLEEQNMCFWYLYSITGIFVPIFLKFGYDNIRQKF